jgi:predicted flap endonuclease-1-like 5' DNA nuclease
VNLPAGSSVASIPAYAADHSCAILDNGSVYCWGYGSAFGGSSVSTPQHLPLPAGRTPVSIQADHLFTCVNLDNGSMMCVGSNSYLQLGYNGSATNTFSYVEYLPQGAVVVDMSLSEYSACALLDDGDVWCWGYNGYEALGVSGGGTTYNYAVQPNIPSGNITAIEGHVRGHCSLYDNGSVACWGSNSNGERGIGNFTSNNLATQDILFTQPMPGNLSVTSLATGDHTVCALLSNGSVACWGDAYANGYSSDTNTPTLIPWPHGSVQATAISVGWYHGCALLENGSMWCWGQNSNGQLGDGTTTDSVSGTFVDLDQAAHVPFVSMSGATCSVDPALPTGLSMAQGNCTISGTPTGTSSTTTYTVYANTSAGTSRSEISITVVANPMFPSVDGAQLRVDQAMTNITFQYGTGPSDVSGATSCSTTPALPSGLSVDGSNCTISGTPTAATVNTTYMVMAEISGTTYAAEIWLEVLGLIGPVVGVNNTLLPDVHPMYTGANLTYEVEPSLPASLSLNATTGVISGTPTETLGNTTFTLYANDTNGDSLQWNISIEILEDTDGDGLPNLLPPDYDGENDDHRPTPGLTEDLDDDNDGLNDTNETDTGSYVDESDTGTDPLDPDTDDDGFCDGPIAVPGVCFAGPDPYPHDPNLPIDTDGDGLPDNDDDWDGPPFADEDDDGDGYPDTSEVACGSDPLDSSSLPEDMDGDGICDGDDLDMDGDGIDNVNETGLPVGTLPGNPDTDGDGICDGPVSPVTSNCTAGPDAFPLDPSAGTDTDGDGMPDELFPGVNSTSEPPLIEDLDDDNDNWSDIDEVNCLTDPLNASSIPVDINGDGLCDLMDDDWDDDGIPNANETDTGTYVDESDTGTDPWNPDTDGDGFCDGPLGVMNGTEVVCIAGPDPFPHDPTLPIDTDGDGMPDDLPPGYEGNLVADEDDDNDGFSDASENACGSDPLDDTSHPDDMDGDAICDGDDTDMDGDGIENIAELGAPFSTEPDNPDTDGDGVCDGPAVPANGGCTLGPDAFPLDPAGAKDTDGDGKPDQLISGQTSTSDPPLIEDLDDDNDTWSDFDEGACGTDPLDDASTPTDTDGDGLCDTLDPYLDLPFTLEYPTQYVDLFVNQTMDPLLPWVNGSGDVVTWELEGELPEGLTFGWSPARDAMMDGSIRGTPANATETLSLVVWANNSFYSESFALSLTVFNDSDNDSLPDELPEGYVGNLTADLDDDNDGLTDAEETVCGSDPLDAESGRGEWVTACLDLDSDNEDDGFGWVWCFPCLLLLLLLLLIPLLLGRDRLLVMMADGPEPEYTVSEPPFVAGSGTIDDPFILAPVGPLHPGAMESTVETITITNMGDIKVDMVDFNDEHNYGRFNMHETALTMEGSGRVVPVGKDGEIVINFTFDDREFPTYEGGTYNASIKLGKASVYFLWEVTVMADESKAKSEKKNTMDRIKKRKKAFNFDRIGKATAKNKDDLQAIKGIGPYSEEKLNALGIFTYAQLANFDRKTEDEVNDAIEHYKGRIRRDEWVQQARDIIGAVAKADEEALKAAEEAQAKAEAEAKAAEEAEAAKKAKAAEEAEAAKKAKADEEEAAKAAAAAAAAEKEAKEAEKKAKAEADKKAKEEAAAAAAAEKEAKEAEKKAKAEADEKAKEEAAAAKKAEEEAKKAAAAAAKPVTKEAKKEEELKRVKERSKSIDFKVLGTAKASDKDDLQAIKGIGPFIEEKLNALGIYTWLQISKMTDKLEDQVNEAIEFFPGRVKRDQWVNQAKILLGEDVKLDEKALKQAEELARVEAKAETIDFATLGVASAAEKDDLKSIKGIGPFIEEKLNALGIYTFEQVSKMTAKIEEEVNVAIEFFPGRVKRDEWAKQAKKLHKDKK